MTPITDTQRLDWLESRSAPETYWSMTGDELVGGFSYPVDKYPSFGYKPTARQAIDHAMEQEQKLKSEVSSDS